MIKKPLLLMILDGWGLPQGGEGDGLSQASLPVFSALWNQYPHAQLKCSGLAVGLPEGQMGNSEVGHANIGSGRVLYQDVMRINMAIENGSFFSNSAILQAINYVKSTGGALHLWGLLSDGGVHSEIEHLFALLDLTKRQGLSKVFVHCFTDGRDTPPKSALTYVAQLEEEMARLGIGKIASVSGRFFAMDRDKRWDRVERAWRALVLGEGHKAQSAAEAVQAAYDTGLSDEFIEPTVICRDGKPLATVTDGDAIIFFNYRSDRAREISHAFTDNNQDFPFFPRLKQPHVFYTAMTAYDNHLKAAVAYPPEQPDKTLGQIVSEQGLAQLRIAETEKYAHVTFFFNGGREEKYAGEDRVLVPSPRVETYDLQPQMSAEEVTDKVLERLKQDKYDLIVLNFANPDMVGHTGKIEAVKIALEFVDQSVGRIIEVIKQKSGTAIITADHGNVEKMLAADGSPMTAHTIGPVPIILIEPQTHYGLANGALCDIAPTVLQLLDLEQPQEMKGKSLLRQ